SPVEMHNMTKSISRFVVLFAFIMASASVYAHHSLAGVYALGKEAKVTGAFKAFRLVNPHSTMKIDVKNKDGSVTEWTFLGGSVGQIARLGLKEGPNALKPGDEITVTIVPAIDGKSPVGLLSAITYADGHTVRFRSPDE
ncbi:MAG TPA: DUF6152 family protein, partial [Vicinamibacterales bacterium]|nr:DUF6152 family protein [Vicinamibacterales bacterium]